MKYSLLIVLFLRFILGFIFTTAGFSKLIYFEKFIENIRMYQIIPEKFEKKAVWVIIAIELIIGSALIFGIFLRIVSLGIVLMMIIYFAAATNSLYHNRYHNCGCGGIIGTRKLSAEVLIQDIIIIICAVVISLPYNQYFTLEYFLYSYPNNELPIIYGFIVLMLSIITVILLALRKNKLNNL